MAIALLTRSEKNSIAWRQRGGTLWQWPGNCRATCRTPSLDIPSRSSMTGASKSSRFLYSFETFKGWRGVLWLPDHMGCHNLDSVRAGLCPRGGEAAIDDFSVGHNLPIPARRTVPGDTIRKCAFLSHHAEAWPRAAVGLYSPKVPRVCLLADRAIIFFVVRSGRLRDLRFA